MNTEYALSRGRIVFCVFLVLFAIALNIVSKGQFFALIGDLLHYVVSLV